MAWWLTTTVISPTASPSMVIVGIFYGATMGFFSLFDGSKRTLHRDVMGYTVSYKPNVDCWVYNEDTMGYHSGLGPMIW